MLSTAPSSRTDPVFWNLETLCCGKTLKTTIFHKYLAIVIGSNFHNTRVLIVATNMHSTGGHHTSGQEQNHNVTENWIKEDGKV